MILVETKGINIFDKSNNHYNPLKLLIWYKPVAIELI